MEKSKLSGSFEPIGSGAFREEAIEAHPSPKNSPDQLAIPFVEEPRVREGSVRSKPPLLEIPPSSGPTFSGLHVIHLDQTPVPFVYDRSVLPPLPRLIGKQQARAFPYNYELRTLFKREYDETTEPKIRAFVNKFYEVYLAGKSYTDMVVALYDVVRVGNVIARQIYGVGGGSKQWDRFLQALPEVLIAHHDFSEQEREYFFNYLNTTLLDESLPEQSTDYNRSLMQTFDMVFSSYVSDRQYAKRSELVVTEVLEEILTREQPELRAMADTFFHEAMTQWTGGVKSSFFQDEDSLFHDPSEAWVVMNPIDAQEPTPGVLAIFYLTERDDVVAKGLEVTRSETPTVSRNVIHQNRGPEFEKKVEWMMGYDGEFYVPIVEGFNCYSVRELYRRIGQEPYYELLRVNMIAHIRDMMVPGDSVAHMPSHTRFMRQIRALGLEGVTGDLKTIVSTFLIPRQEYDHDTRQSARDQMEEEEEIQRVLGDLVTKNLQGQIVKLPLGHHRTARAEQLLLDDHPNDGEGRLKKLREDDPDGHYSYKKTHPHRYYVKHNVVPEQKSDAGDT